MSERARLSETLRDFNAEVSALDNATRYEIRKAVLAAGSPADPPTRKLADGRTVSRTDVDISVIVAVLPPELKLDGKALARAVASECQYRGEAWAGEGLYGALVGFLDCGNPTHDER